MSYGLNLIGEFISNLQGIPAMFTQPDALSSLTEGSAELSDFTLTLKHLTENNQVVETNPIAESSKSNQSEKALSIFSLTGAFTFSINAEVLKPQPAEPTQSDNVTLNIPEPIPTGITTKKVIKEILKGLAPEILKEDKDIGEALNQTADAESPDNESQDSPAETEVLILVVPEPAYQRRNYLIGLDEEIAKNIIKGLSTLLQRAGKPEHLKTEKILNSSKGLQPENPARIIQADTPTSALFNSELNSEKVTDEKQPLLKTNLYYTFTLKAEDYIPLMAEDSPAIKESPETDTPLSVSYPLQHQGRYIELVQTLERLINRLEALFRAEGIEQTSWEDIKAEVIGHPEGAEEKALHEPHEGVEHTKIKLHTALYIVGAEDLEAVEKPVITEERAVYLNRPIEVPSSHSRNDQEVKTSTKKVAFNNLSALSPELTVSDMKDGITSVDYNQSKESASGQKHSEGISLEPPAIKHENIEDPNQETLNPPDNEVLNSSNANEEYVGEDVSEEETLNTAEKVVSRPKEKAETEKDISGDGAEELKSSIEHKTSDNEKAELNEHRFVKDIERLNESQRETSNRMKIHSLKLTIESTEKGHIDVKVLLHNSTVRADITIDNLRDLLNLKDNIFELYTSLQQEGFNPGKFSFNLKQRGGRGRAIQIGPALAPKDVTSEGINTDNLYALSIRV